MPKCIIDGIEAEFEPGENLVEVAARVGITIPVFCYHPGLSVVAQCRMCTVEVEKMGKLQTACSTAAQEGMVVHTDSELAKRNRESVMEFLLINHPLDCPICDKSGECDLQDSSYEYGSSYQRYTEERRTYVDLDMGPVIKKNMNRCIHCTRCIRFGDEIANIREMIAVKRGNNTEITTLNGRSLETDYAGNYADICPTGSLTLKDFRFHKRAWMLKKTPTICEGCSRGCNMEIQHESDVIYRCIPRENMEINRYWLCDEGRFNYHYVHDKNRITHPVIQGRNGLEITDWTKAVQVAKETFVKKKLCVLVGSDLTQEEVDTLQKFLSKDMGNPPVFHFGTPGVKSSKDDEDADSILKRKSKTSNLNGLEKAGLKGFDKLPAGTEAVLVLRGGRAMIPDFGDLPAIGIGVFSKEWVKGYQAVLPGASFAEKSGTVFNFEGREQKFERAIYPPKDCKYLAEILMMLTNTKSTETGKIGAA